MKIQLKAGHDGDDDDDDDDDDDNDDDDDHYDDDNDDVYYSSLKDNSRCIWFHVFLTCFFTI